MIHNEQKQTHARDLYFQSDLTTTQIADILAIPRRTLHYWIKQKNWDRQKQAAEHMPALLAENCYHLIAKFTEQLLSETRLMKPITHKEADALYKLTLTVNKLKNRYTLNESMELFGNFIDKLNSVAPDLAKQVSPFVDECIANQSSKYVSQYRPAHFNSQGLIPVPEVNVKEKQLDLQDIMAWEEEASQQQAMEQSGNETLVKPLNNTTGNVAASANTPISTPADDAPCSPEIMRQLQEALTEFSKLPGVDMPASVSEFLELGGGNKKLNNAIPNTPPPRANAA